MCHLHPNPGVFYSYYYSYCLRYEENLSMQLTRLDYQTQPILDNILMEAVDSTTRLDYITIQVMVGRTPVNSNFTYTSW